MRNLRLATVLVFALCAFAASAQPGAIRALQPLVGVWIGKAQFASKRPELADPIDCMMRVTAVLKGHYFHCEQTLLIPNQPSDTLMLLTFSPTAGLFEAWSYNENSPGARLLTGTLEPVVVDKGKTRPFDPTVDKPDPVTHELPPMEQHLTLTSLPEYANGETIAYREYYNFTDRDHITMTYSIRRQDVWQEVYVANYARKKQ